MKRIVLTSAIFVMLGAPLALTQPTPMSRPKPAPMPAAMAKPAAPMPAAMPAAMATAPKPAAAMPAAMAKPAAPKPAAPAKPAAMAAAPKPAAMAAPAMAAPMAAMAEKPVVNVTNKVDQKPPWKTPGFWIGVVGAPLVSIIFGLLVAFNVIKKKTVQDDRWQTIMKIVDKGLPAAHSFVKGSKNEVDDIIYEVVKMLVDVVKARVADLTPEEEKKIEALVKSRAHEMEPEGDEAADG